MIATLVVAGYALAVAWGVPAALSVLTASGVSARLGVAAWMSAMASAVISALAALGFLIAAAVERWLGLASQLCRSVAGKECVPALYRSAFSALAAGGAAVIATLVIVVFAWRYGGGLQKSWQKTRAHAEAVRITGGMHPDVPGAIVLDVPQRAAYCVPGRPGTIVLTSAALAVLDRSQLAAVMAHERAHLASRHHLVVTLWRGLASLVPAVPLFSRGHREVARLTELSADDAAARRCGRVALITALLAMGTGAPVSAAALSATASGVWPRVHRLLQPPQRARQFRYRLALATATLLLAGMSTLVTAYAARLAG